jgi:hypothetical protein
VPEILLENNRSSLLIYKVRGHQGGLGLRTPPPAHPSAGFWLSQPVSPFQGAHPSFLELSASRVSRRLVFSLSPLFVFASLTMFSYSSALPGFSDARLAPSAMLSARRAPRPSRCRLEILFFPTHHPQDAHPLQGGAGVAFGVSVESKVGTAETEMDEDRPAVVSERDCGTDSEQRQSPWLRQRAKAERCATATRPMAN